MDHDVEALGAELGDAILDVARRFARASLDVAPEVPLTTHDVIAFLEIASLAFRTAIEELQSAA